MIQSVETFKALDLPQPQWLLEGVVPGAGMTLIAAPGKTGKSLWAIQLCHTLAMPGTSFLGITPKTNQKVLYVQADCPARTFQKQLRYYEATGFHVALMPKGFMSRNKERNKLLEEVKNQEFSFICWDAFESLFSVDPNDYKNVQAAIILLETFLPKENGFMLIHHPRKAGSGQVYTERDDPRDIISGAKFFTTNANAILCLTAKPRSKKGKLLIMPDREEVELWKLKRVTHGFWEFVAKEEYTEEPEEREEGSNLKEEKEKPVQKSRRQSRPWDPDESSYIAAALKG